MASAATCRDPSAEETAVEVTTVPLGNEMTSAGNPSTILPWVDAVAGKGKLMRGAGGDGAGNPEGDTLTGGRTSRPEGAGAEPPADPPVGVGVAAPWLAPAGVPTSVLPGSVLEPVVGGLLPAGAATRDAEGSSAVIWSSTTAVPPRIAARPTPAMTSRWAFTGSSQPSRKHPLRPRFLFP
jgi:hypothetical protein